MKIKFFAVCAGAMLAATVAAPASADIVRVDSTNFQPAAGVITFSEKAFGTYNPVYTAAEYGGGSSAPTVSFGGFFAGQQLSANPSADCPGAAASACLSGAPSAGLSLSATSPSVFITNDGSNPTSPVLSGYPTFNGPITVLFSVDQLAVGFDGGYFNAVNSTGIRAFDRAGNIIGTVSNTQIGIEFLGIATTDNIAKIAGVQLTLVGSEPAGFAIDNLRFGTVGQVVIPGGVPEPATWAMMIMGFATIGGAMRRRVKKVSFAAA